MSLHMEARGRWVRPPVSAAGKRELPDKLMVGEVSDDLRVAKSSFFDWYPKGSTLAVIQ
ncbi:hypothetical protein ACIBEA_06550 [Streptomyces sp. NPDC051555]|uniref:hypothetical protein n=1 Tax=Streptomyces sp. NPDC051555 TaxID=3365657 RepID=UPI0037B4ACCB